MSQENQTQQQEAPTKEQIIAHMNEQIEIMELRVKLQELHAANAMARAEELKAIAFMSQLTQTPQEDTSLTEEEPATEGKKLKKA